MAGSQRRYGSREAGGQGGRTPASLPGERSGRGAASLRSSLAACLWIPSFALRCEESRRPELCERPTAVLAPEDSRRVWQLSRAARREGVKAGMTVSQAIGLCPLLTVIEPDPVHYDEQFAHLLLRLSDVSPVIEPAELGRVYVGVDGLERLIGPAEVQLARLAAVVASASSASPALRLGWGLGKFLAWVAATRAEPGGSIIVAPGAEREFLAHQPLAVLPLDPDNLRRLKQLGLRTLGEFAALPESAATAQFGREGRAAWRLAAGQVLEPVLGRHVPEPIRATLDYPSPVGDRGMLAHTIGVLIEHALRDPRRTGWRVHAVRVRTALEHGGSWMIQSLLKDPSAVRERILAPLVARLEASPPTGAVESVIVEFTAFARGTDELQLFARDAVAAARAGRRRALRTAAHEIRQRLNQSLFRVVEVHPWSRLPERRYALIVFEP